MWLDIVEEAKNKKYKLGEHDCLKLACDVIFAQIGVDYWVRFRGYKTRRGATARIAKIAPSLRSAVSIVLQKDENPPLMAQRGDIILYKDVDEHLGVCVGEKCAVLGENRLLYIPVTHSGIKCSWRIRCLHQ